jgi:hypothetical protein
MTMKGNFYGGTSGLLLPFFKKGVFLPDTRTVRGCFLRDASEQRGDQHLFLPAADGVHRFTVGKRGLEQFSLYF